MNYNIHNKIDESEKKNTEYKKQDTKEYILYDSIYVNTKTGKTKL